MMFNGADFARSAVPLVAAAGLAALASQVELPTAAAPKVEIPAPPPPVAATAADGTGFNWKWLLPLLLLIPLFLWWKSCQNKPSEPESSATVAPVDTTTQQYQHQQHRWNKHLTAISTGSSLILTRLKLLHLPIQNSAPWLPSLKKIVVLLGSW